MFVLRKLRFVLDRIPTFFEEPEVARYITLAESAGGFTIPDPAAQLPVSDRHFQDVVAPGLINGSLPVIFFRTTHTRSPSFGVRLNSTSLTQHTFSQADPHAWHEIIPTGALKPEANELTFSVSGDGNGRFSDVVILYKSNKLTVKRPIPERDQFRNQSLPKRELRVKTDKPLPGQDHFLRLCPIRTLTLRARLWLQLREPMIRQSDSR